MKFYNESYIPLIKINKSVNKLDSFQFYLSLKSFAILYMCCISLRGKYDVVQNIHCKDVGVV